MECERRHGRVLVQAQQPRGDAERAPGRSSGSARRSADRPELAPPGRVVSKTFTPNRPTFPNGCRLRQVEIGAGTGAISVVGDLAVENAGRVLNPIAVGPPTHRPVNRAARFSRNAATASAWSSVALDSVS